MFQMRNFSLQKTAFFLTILFVLFQNGSGQTALELNKPLERKISGIEEKHAYLISLDENQYAQILLEQTTVDVSAKLYDAEGKFLNSFDNEFLLKKNETVEFVAAQKGVYKIEIKIGSKAWSGNYTIRLAELREANENDRQFSQLLTLFEQAENAKNEEKLNDAATLYQRALENAEKMPRKSGDLISRIFSGLIETYNFKGDYPAALTILDRAAAFNSQNFGEDHPRTALTIFQRGNYFRSNGDRASADRFYRQSLAIYENALGAEHPLLFDPMLKLSGLYISMDDLDGALVYLKRLENLVTKHYGADDKMMAGIFNNLGVVYMSKSDWNNAEKYFLKTMEIGEKLKESGQYRYTLTMQNLAVIYKNKKNLPLALEYYRRTLETREKVLGSEHLQVGWANFGISNTYFLMNDPVKALESLTRAREIAEKSGGLYHSLTTISMRGAVRVLASQGEIERAVVLQKLHDERYEKFFTSEMTIGSERQKLLAVKKLESLTSQTISLHLNAARNNQTAIDSAALVILKRKGRVLDAVADNLTALRNRTSEADRVLIDRFNDVNARLSKLTLEKPPKITTVEYEKQLAELQSQKEKTEVEIGDRNALFPAQNHLIALETVKAEIPANAALVEFAVYFPFDFNAKNETDDYGKPRYIAYVLQKNGEVKFAELGDKQTIDNAIDDLRKALRDSSRKDVRQVARTADEKIMKPVRAVLGDAKQIFISPDGDLNLIPFEALIDEKGVYLIENYSFDYLTSGRDLLRMKTARASKSESLIVANPSFGSLSGVKIPNNVTATRNLSETYFAPLVQTEREARSIQTLFPNAKVLTKADADESALKTINAPRILHIATHGFFLEDTDQANAETNASNRSIDAKSATENPLLRSGLAFAGANKRGTGSDKDDGILTALEASGLNLWGTKLVVLSACDTGIGDVKNGEGVYGLRRAFTLAGTESLVMSLWEVGDYSPRELMSDYYKNLKNGLGRNDSLRQAQLEMMKKKDRAHPFYWAAFIQSGEWANLDGKR